MTHHSFPPATVEGRLVVLTTRGKRFRSVITIRSFTELTGKQSERRFDLPQRALANTHEFYECSAPDDCLTARRSHASLFT
jgi:hypothetical protein